MRRILIAGLLAILLGSSTALGLAQANDASDAAWTGLGEARDGDVYAYEGHHDVTYQLTGGDMVLAPDGRLHQARWLQEGLAVRDDFRTLQVLGSKGTHSTSGGGSQEQSALVGWDLDRNFALPCGMVTSLRDAIGVPGSITVDGDCGEARLQFMAHATVDDRAALIYAGDGMEIAYAEGVPVPVRIEVDGQVTRLVGYAKGEAQFKSSVEADAPTMDPAAITRYGPEGIEELLPFTLEAAMELAARPDQPTAAFLTSHPDWQIVEATGAVRHGENWQDVLWSVHVQDGADAMRMTIISSQDEPAGVPLLASSGESARGNLADPIEVVHDALPTVMDALAWLEQSGEDDVTDIRFTLTDRPIAPLALGSAPLMAFATSGSGVAPREPATEPRDGLSLMFDANGVLVGRLASHTTQGTQEPDWPPMGPLSSGSVVSSMGGLEIAAAAGVLGLAVAALYWFAPAIKTGLGAALFSRRAPDHPVRAKLLRIVQVQPGIHYRALHRAADVGQGALEHHLRVLVRDGRLRRRDEGGYACYYVGRPTRPAPKSGGGRSVLAAVAQGPASISQLAKRTGLSPSTVAYHVKRLEQDACVRTERQGRSRLVWPEA